MDFKSDEKDMTGDRESNQEATLPGAGDPGAGDPGTRLPGTDGVTVEDLIRQLEKEKLMRRRAERALVKQKRINLAPRKRNNSVNKKLKQMFTSDQIRALGQENRQIRWGKETIKKDLRVKFVVRWPPVVTF